MRFLLLPLKSRRAAGFSLVELMVVLAIATILMTIAIPSFKTFIDRQKVLTVAADLYASVSLTRSEAIRRGARVYLLPKDGAAWSNGWVVQTDPADPKTIVYSRDGAPTQLQITPSFSPNNSDLSLVYDGTGRTSSKGSVVARSGFWNIKIGNEQRNLIINLLGRPYLCDPAKTSPC
jgi:type IV fimbrial biogenesis protein FimT